MASHLLNWQDLPPAPCRGGGLTIGNFDGVHRGHAALLAELRRQTDRVGGPAVALTFDPHPLQLLRPGTFLPVLTTLADRVDLLHSQGADHVVVLRTTPDLLNLTPEEFFAEVIRHRFQARTMVEGVNFGFGRGRLGNVEVLARLCREASIPLTVVPPIEMDGRPVSSSRVRDVLVRGLVREAALMLGHAYRLHGRVVSGSRRGRTIGFPTANLEAIENLVPGDGVYVVRALHGDSTWPGAANIGPNPTFAEATRKVEVHLIGFSGELVGQELTVEFVDRLRDTRKFAGVEELVEQLRNDVDRARQIIQQDVGHHS